MTRLRFAVRALGAGSVLTVGGSLSGAPSPSGAEWSPRLGTFTWHPTRWSWFESSGWIPPEHVPAPTTAATLPPSVLPVALDPGARPQ